MRGAKTEKKDPAGALPVLAAVLFGLLFFNFSGTALAADEGKLRIGEVVVTALRAEEQVEKIPANVTVITEEDIRESTARTVQDLLEGEAGLIVRDLYGTGTKSAVDMRGFARGLNTAVLVDGRKVNAVDLSGVDWNLIPLENIERIEIVRGSGSVLYGDHATAGAINIITKKGVTARPEVEAEARVESYSGHSEHLSVGGSAGRLGYFLFGKYRETDGYRENSEFRAKDLKSTLTYDFTDNLFVELRGGWHEDHQGLPGGLTAAELSADRRQSVKPDDSTDFDRHFYGARVVYAPGREELEAEYNLNDREFDSTAVFFGTSFDTSRETETRDAKLKLSSRRDLLGHGNLLTAGFDYLGADVENTTSFMGSVTPSTIDKTERGYYVNEEFSITGAWVLNAGYRHTDAEYEDVVGGASPGSGMQEFDENSYTAGVAYNYAPGSKVYASFTRGFRLPTTDELFSFDGTIVDLRPERTDTYEAGAVHAVGEGSSVSLTVYSMEVEDELFFNQSTFTNENLDETLHKGLELGFKAGLTDYLSLDGSWSYTDATFESGPFSGKTIPLIPEHTASLGATVAHAGLVLAVDANWVGERFLENDLDNASDGLDDYTVVDARLSYTYKTLTAFVGVNNVLDEEYNVYGVQGTTRTEFYPAPERNYYGGVRLSF